MQNTSAKYNKMIKNMKTVAVLLFENSLKNKNLVNKPSLSSARIITSADEYLSPMAAPMYGKSFTLNFSSFSYNESSMILTGHCFTTSF